MKKEEKTKKDQVKLIATSIVICYSWYKIIKNIKNGKDRCKMDGEGPFFNS